jgi:hypothetical protein
MTDTLPCTAPDELETLRALVAGAAAGTGEEFFRSLVRHLAAATGTRHARPHPGLLVGRPPRPERRV